MAVVNINGRLCGERDAIVSVFDHGFLFGDGVYEVLRTYDGEPFLLRSAPAAPASTRRR